MVASFRGRILAIVVAVGVLPLGLVGLWMASATARSGGELLRARLDHALDQAALLVGSNWTLRRSELLDLADSDAVRSAFRRQGGTAAPRLGAWLERNGRHVRRITIRREDGTLVAAAVSPLADDGAGAAFHAGVAVAVDVHDGPLGPRLGTLEAILEPAGLLEGAAPALAGTVLGAFRPEDGLSLLPVPFDQALLERDRFELAGDEWLTARRRLADPPVELVAAAALGPYTRPFEDTARAGAWLLAAAAGVGVLLAFLLTTRLTRSLERLAAAAEAVARGELDRRVDVAGADEVGRVARAFNAMTESLRRTLAELADRRALAAVGEFAASLAHEIRNPLTAIQLDLQRVEERIPPEDPTAREIQARALAEVRRLENTVAGALRAARSGRIPGEAVDLLGSLRAAGHAAAPAVERAGARLELPPDDAPPLLVRGDPGALEQLFLNLLLNAAEAVSPGGLVAALAGRADGEAFVAIEDDGAGIPPDDLERVFEPLFSTRHGGVGLGLGIARRLAEAHGGRLALEPRPGGGTRAVVRLPLAEPAPAGS